MLKDHTSRNKQNEKKTHNHHHQVQKQTKNSKQFCCSFSQWLLEYIIEVNTDDWRLCHILQWKLILTRSGIFLEGNPVPRVAGVLLLPTISPKITTPFCISVRGGLCWQKYKGNTNWKTLWNCHSFNSCRNPMGLGSELFVEDTGKGDIYELVSLQPSLCFCLYQHFLMPSQGGGGGGERVGSGVFSGE